MSLIRFNLGQNWDVKDQQIKIFGWMDQGHHSCYPAILLLKVRVDYKLLLGHVGLPHVLVLAVHMVNFFSWVSQGGHSEQLLFLHFFTRTLLHA